MQCKHRDVYSTMLLRLPGGVAVPSSDVSWKAFLSQTGQQQWGTIYVCPSRGKNNSLHLLTLQGPPGRPGLPGSDGVPGPPGTILMLPVSSATFHCLISFTCLHTLHSRHPPMNLVHLVSLPHSTSSRPRDYHLISFKQQITCLVNASQPIGVEPVTEALGGLMTNCVCACVSACAFMCVCERSMLLSYHICVCETWWQLYRFNRNKLYFIDQERPLDAPLCKKRQVNLLFHCAFFLFFTVPCWRRGTQGPCGFSPGSSGSGHPVSGQGQYQWLMWQQVKMINFCDFYTFVYLLVIFLQPNVQIEIENYIYDVIWYYLKEKHD